MIRKRRHFLRATDGSWTAIALVRPRVAETAEALTPCSRCGALRGRAEHQPGVVVDVHCWCESPRCDRCSELVWAKSPAPYYFNERRQRVIHVPGLAALVHRCRSLGKDPVGSPRGLGE